MCVHVYVCMSAHALNLESWVLDYLVHIAVNDRALKKVGRGEQMADSLSLRQRATIHTSYWPQCLAALLCFRLEEQRLARLISVHFAMSALLHRGCWYHLYRHKVVSSR